MANGESPGKSIALLIFVSLTAITGISTYYFVDKVLTLEKIKTEADLNATAAKKSQDEVDRKYAEISERVIGAGQRAHDEMMTAVKADLQSPKINASRAQVRPAYKSYSDAVTYLSDELRASDARKLALLADIDELSKQLAAMQQRYQLDVDEAVSAKDAKDQELTSEKQKLSQLVAQKDKEIAEIQSKFGQKLTELQQIENDTESQSIEFTKLISATRALIDNIGYAEQLRGQLQYERPDGSVVQTVPALGQAYINLGYEDKLFNGLTFSIYSNDTGGNPYLLPKANIEVVRVGPKRSLARVTNEDPLHPVLPGDLLYNPVWSKDQTAGVAFVGQIFVDDDETPDNELFASLIEQAGGRVDAQMPDMRTPRIEGKINIDTSWLIIGEIPEASDSKYQTEVNQVNTAITTAMTEMRRDAAANGVRVLNVRNFLTFMGLDAPQRTVVAGAEEQYYFGKPRPRLVDEAPRPAIEEKKDEN